jgi:3-hydroxyacyl-[acyl-carrier-protein] dehydratase
MAQNACNSAHCGYFFFDPDDPIFQSHFPGYPVVPGSLIIHAFVEALDAADQNRGTWCVSDFRFKRFIPPGRYAYCIEPKSHGRMACFLYADGKAVVTGMI